MSDPLVIHHEVGDTVAFVHGFPLNMAEALAFQAFQAGDHTQHDAEILAAWRVKTVLIHGYGALDKLAFINLEDVLRT